MKRKKKNNLLEFSSGMAPKSQEKERKVITDKPLSKSKTKTLRFRDVNFNEK